MSWKPSELFHKTPYAVKLPFLYLKYYLQSHRPALQTIRRLDFRLFSECDASRIRKSDTVFILGSGGSINEISESRWRAIARHDSIGFNFWLYHRFVPSIYAVEGIVPHDADAVERIRRICSLMREREEDYLQTVKLVSEISPQRAVDAYLKGGFKKRMYALLNVPAFVETERHCRLSVALVKKLGFFSRSSRFHGLFKHNGSVTGLISLAVRMGYRKIVLCGIDLNNSNYFYQDPALYPETDGFQSSSRTPVHATLMANAHRYSAPVDRIIYELKRQVLDPAGIELYVENASSALHPALPLAPESIYCSEPARSDALNSGMN